MLLCFYKQDGSPRMISEFSHFTGRRLVPDEQVQYDDFNHSEGDVVPFHMGHGVYHDFLVEAIDKDVALLRQITGYGRTWPNTLISIEE